MTINLCVNIVCFDVGLFLSMKCTRLGLIRERAL